MFFEFLFFDVIWLFKQTEIQYTREVLTGYYSKSVYFIVSVLLDTIKYRLLPPLIFTLICYWTIGLHPGRVLWFLSYLTYASVLSGFMAILIGCISTVKIGVTINGLFILFNVLTSGLVFNSKNMPEWFSKFVYCGFWKPAYEALMINEFSGTNVFINPEGFKKYKIKVTGVWWLNELGMYPQRLNFDIVLLSFYLVIYFLLALFAFRTFVRVKK